MTTAAKSLLNNAATTTTFEAIDALAVDLSKLSKAAVVEVATAVGLVGMGGRTKAKVVAEIVGRIRSIKQSSMRAKLI